MAKATETSSVTLGDLWSKQIRTGIMYKEEIGLEKEEGACTGVLSAFHGGARGIPSFDLIGNVCGKEGEHRSQNKKEDLNTISPQNS